MSACVIACTCFVRGPPWRTPTARTTHMHIVCMHAHVKGIIYFTGSQRVGACRVVYRLLERTIYVYNVTRFVYIFGIEVRIVFWVLL